MKKVNLAVVGATGMVGRKVLDILKERNFPLDKLYLFASKKSAGEKIIYKNENIEIIELTKNSFKNKNIDIAIFSAGGNISLEYAPLFNEEGIIVIDNSSAWRNDDKIPLIVPEINKEKIKGKLIANPNCSTIQSVIALKPIYDKFGIKRIVYNTYQAVSGAGVKGVDDLEKNTTNNFKYKIKENTIPQIDDFLENGYTKEEMKMVNETKKILSDDSIKITATAVRVPIKNSHAVSINIETRREFDIKDVFKVLKNAPGVKLCDNKDEYIYPLQEIANGTDEILVGRIRRDYSVDNGINLYCVGDNIRKGAATNTVQIAEEIIKNMR